MDFPQNDHAHLELGENIQCALFQRNDELPASESKTENSHRMNTLHTSRKAYIWHFRATEKTLEQPDRRIPALPELNVCGYLAALRKIP